MLERPTHRMRRGKLVEIPEEWRGQVPSNQTLLQRKSEQRQVKADRKSRLLKVAKEHWNNQLED